MQRKFQWQWNGQSGSFVSNDFAVAVLRQILEDDEIVVRKGSFTRTDPGVFFKDGKKGLIWKIWYI
jgi:hypothetical protein